MTHERGVPKRPHIVIFNPDQWRGDVVGYRGNTAARTPQLDELIATDAVAFTRAFCQNPVCTPSRCSFMSGWYPHVRGHRTMFHMLREDEPLLLRTLKRSGYFVWWGGKNDLVPAQHGYASCCDVRYDPTTDPQASRPVRPMFAKDREAEWRGDPEGDQYYSFLAGALPGDEDGRYYDSDWANVEAAIRQIHDWGQRCREDPDTPPLCLFLALTYPHPPYGVESAWRSLIDEQALPPRVEHPTTPSEPSILTGIRERQRLSGWDEARWDELRATYYAMCARVDHQLGLVVQALRDAGMYDDTGLFFFSDHGDYTGDYGLVEKTQNTFDDCLVNVPLVIKPPRGVDARPGVRDALVELIDVPATIEDLTGVTSTHDHFGSSLVPLMRGERDEHRDAVFCEGGRLHGERQAMELESAAHDDPTGLYWPRLSLQAGEGPEHTKAVMCRTENHKYVRRRYETDELYDLRADPHEQVNLIDSAQHREIRDALADRLLTWYQDTADVVPHDPDRRH